VHGSGGERVKLPRVSRPSKPGKEPRIHGPSEPIGAADSTTRAAAHRERPADRNDQTRAASERSRYHATVRAIPSRQSTVGA
jgi:hypothetical protein